MPRAFYGPLRWCLICGAAFAMQTGQVLAGGRFEAPLSDLVSDSAIGKYPSDIGLFSVPVIRERLCDLMGPDFKKVEMGFTMESPIVMEWTGAGKYLVIEGHKRHEGDKLRTTIVMDLTEDRIHVAVREGCGISRYFDFAGGKKVVGPGYRLRFEVEVLRWHQIVYSEAC